MVSLPSPLPFRLLEIEVVDVMLGVLDNHEAESYIIHVSMFTDVLLVLDIIYLLFRLKRGLINACCSLYLSLVLSLSSID